jgi:hypothetical protein
LSLPLLCPINPSFVRFSSESKSNQLRLADMTSGLGSRSGRSIQGSNAVRQQNLADFFAGDKLSQLWL